MRKNNNKTSCRDTLFAGGLVSASVVCVPFILPGSLSYFVGLFLDMQFADLQCGSGLYFPGYRLQERIAYEDYSLGYYDTQVGYPDGADACVFLFLQKYFSE